MIRLQCKSTITKLSEKYEQISHKFMEKADKYSIFINGKIDEILNNSSKLKINKLNIGKIEFTLNNYRKLDFIKGKEICINSQLTPPTSGQPIPVQPQPQTTITHLGVYEYKETQEIRTTLLDAGFKITLCDLEVMFNDNIKATFKSTMKIKKTEKEDIKSAVLDIIKNICSNIGVELINYKIKYNLKSDGEFSTAFEGHDIICGEITKDNSSLLVTKGYTATYVANLSKEFNKFKLVGNFGFGDRFEYYNSDGYKYKDPVEKEFFKPYDILDRSNISGTIGCNYIINKDSKICITIGKINTKHEDIIPTDVKDSSNKDIYTTGIYYTQSLVLLLDYIIKGFLFSLETKYNFHEQINYNKQNLNFNKFKTDNIELNLVIGMMLLKNLGVNLILNDIIKLLYNDNNNNNMQICIKWSISKHLNLDIIIDGNYNFEFALKYKKPIYEGIDVKKSFTNKELPPLELMSA